MSVDGPWEAVDQPGEPKRPEERRTNAGRTTASWDEAPIDIPDNYESDWPEPKADWKEPPTDENVEAATPAEPETDLVEDRGPGVWGPTTEFMSERAQSYQTQITGAPPGMAYYVGTLKFDGYADGVLQDAKGPGYEHFVKDGEFRDWFTGADKIVEQARQQSRASNGFPITWYIAEKQTLEVIDRLLLTRGITGIKLVHVPAVE